MLIRASARARLSKHNGENNDKQQKKKKTLNRVAQQMELVTLNCRELFVCGSHTTSEMHPTKIISILGCGMAKMQRNILFNLNA